MKWSGSCQTCSQWNTFIEEVECTEKQRRFESCSVETARPVLIKDVNIKNFKRLKTNMGEFDRLMGGGLVAGSLSLMGGEPGIGKSTMMLQISENFSLSGLRVLYICGEESTEQTSLRAKRLGIGSENLYLLSETVFSNIKMHIDQLKPQVLIIDSIQIVYKRELSSTPGSVTQVREITMECMHLAKGLGITTVLIGHVTKSGEIAGPRILEHIVDTVFEFEGDRQHGYRLVRSIKNRFGPTDDVALFQMTSAGLKEVRNPSEAFLQERGVGNSGSVILPTVEGERSILVEVQSLVAPSSYATPSRRSTGLDQRRLSLLLAVLEKKVGYQLHALDVFVSIAGGMKITEPAIDLAVIVAIASSFCNKPVDPQVVVIGEVGLGGEVRSVARVESRIKEAINMGFKKCVLPSRNLKGISNQLSQKIELHGIELVEEAIRSLVG